MSVASPANDMNDPNKERRRAHLKEVSPGGDPETSPTLGGAFRAQRNKRGEDLAAVGRAIKIKGEYLEAIEEGRYEALPGRPYAIGFVRAYAQHLGLDPNEAVSRFKIESGVAPVTETVTELKTAEPIGAEFRLPQGAAIVGIAVAIVLVIGAIYAFRSASDTLESREPPPRTTVTTVPANREGVVLKPAGGPAMAEAPTLASGNETQSATPAGSAEPTLPSNNGTGTNAGVAVPAGQSAPSLPVTSAPAIADAQPAPPPVTVGGPALVPAPQNATPAVNSPDAATVAVPPAAVEDSFEQAVAAAPKSFGAPNRQNRVVIQAKAEVFVRIETEGARNQVLFEGNLKPGELYYVPAVKDVILVTRNGGALRLFVDGEAKGKAGPEGVALKGLALDPEALKTRP